MEYLRKAEGETVLMKHYHQKIECVGYHAYPLKHEVNKNTDILLIHHMDTRRRNISKTNKYLLQSQLAYICFTHMRIHKNMKFSFESS